MNRIDEKSPCRNSYGRIVLGVLLLGLGTMVLFRSLGLISDPVEDILFSWQALLIALGLIFVSKPDSRIAGVILLCIGGFFMLDEFANLPFNSRQLFWGALFILIGILVLFKNIGHPFRFDNWKGLSPDSLDIMDEVNVFGGSEKRIISSNFKGGKMTNIFGGSTIDFSECQLAEGQNLLDVISIFGGFKFIVPADWTLKQEVTSVFGGVSDKRTHVKETPDNRKILVIRGIAIFGGGEIKNY